MDIQRIHNVNLYVEHPEVSKWDEVSLMFDLWDEEFAPLKGSNSYHTKHSMTNVAREFKLRGRKSYALAPMLIRKAQRLGYKVYVSNSGELHFLDENPVAFWQMLALGQMWYGPDEGV